jgi:hypothetical protein
MLIVNLNTGYNTDTFDSGTVSIVKNLFTISERCGTGVPMLNPEGCKLPYCLPYNNEDTVFFQIYTGFLITYYGWKITAINNKSGATIWTSELKTAGISGVTSVPTGQNMWFRRVAEGGQNIDFFQIPTSSFNFQDVRLLIEYFDNGLTGTDTPVKIAEYDSPCYTFTECNVLQIQSTYDKEDCDGGIYRDVLPYIWTPLAGIAIEPAYSNVFKIVGGIERIDFNYEERTYNSANRVSGFIANEVFRLKTTLPEFAARHLFVVLSGQDLTINGESYRFEGAISKNNDANGWWLIETELIKKCNKSNLC